MRLIKCNKTRRFKGIAYVEFKDPESVPLVSFPEVSNNTFLMKCCVFMLTEWCFPGNGFGWTETIGCTYYCSTYTS